MFQKCIKYVLIWWATNLPHRNLFCLKVYFSKSKSYSLLLFFCFIWAANFFKDFLPLLLSVPMDWFSSKYLLYVMYICPCYAHNIKFELHSEKGSINFLLDLKEVVEKKPDFFCWNNLLYFIFKSPSSIGSAKKYFHTFSETFYFWILGKNGH